MPKVDLPSFTEGESTRSSTRNTCTNITIERGLQQGLARTSHSEWSNESPWQVRQFFRCHSNQGWVSTGLLFMLLFMLLFTDTIHIAPKQPNFTLILLISYPKRRQIHNLPYINLSPLKTLKSYYFPTFSPNPAHNPQNLSATKSIKKF